MIERNECRICRGKLNIVLDLGPIYPSEFIKDLPSSEPQPLQLCECDNCQLVQLKHSINPDSAYRQYWYRSALNGTMVEALQDIVSKIERLVTLTANEIVVDIGANDGTLLGLYTQKPIKIGFDPALNLKSYATNHCDHFINEYFSAARYPLSDKAKVVTSIAMFYDLDDPHAFISDVQQVLCSSGVWVIQMTDLISMLKANAFDNICMEHLEYYSLRVLRDLLQSHDLDVFDVEYNLVNGGSLRAYVCHHSAFPISANVRRALFNEAQYLKSFANPFTAFSQRVEGIKHAVREFITARTNEGKSIGVLGASTKGNTLLQYFQLPHPLITFAAEVNRDKFGLKTPGTAIPIISEEEALARHPDYLLVLPWHFIDSFVARNQAYLKGGGQFLVPLPEPRLISATGSYPLTTFHQSSDDLHSDASMKSVASMIDELITTSIKKHHFAASKEKSAVLLEKSTALSQAIEHRLSHTALETSAIGNLIEELTQTLLKCWDAQERVMGEQDEATVAAAAREAQQLNAKRNRLMREIDCKLGDSALTVTEKTYG